LNKCRHHYRERQPRHQFLSLSPGISPKSLIAMMNPSEWNAVGGVGMMAAGALWLSTVCMYGAASYAGYPLGTPNPLKSTGDAAVGIAFASVITMLMCCGYYHARRRLSIYIALPTCVALWLWASFRILSYWIS
jgi:hypothetical protein